MAATLATAVGIAAPVLELELLAALAFVTVELVLVTLVVVETGTLVVVIVPLDSTLVSPTDPEVVVDTTTTLVCSEVPVEPLEDEEPKEPVVEVGPPVCEEE